MRSSPPTPASAPGPRYLSRLVAHKEVAEEFAGWVLGVSGHEGKLAFGWAPGRVEDAPQSMSHQEHLGWGGAGGGLHQSHRPGRHAPAGRPQGPPLQPVRPA